MLFSVLLVGVASTYAQDVNLINKQGEMVVSTDSILIGNVDAETTAKNLFSEFSISGISVTEDNFVNTLDIRYLSGQLDKKVYSLSDSIPKGAQAFVLFKSEDDGGLVSQNTPIKFTTADVSLTTVAKIDTTGTNKYIEVGKFSYSSKMAGGDMNTVVEEPIIDNVVDTQLIESTKAGIPNNTAFIVIALAALSLLIMRKKY